MPPPIKNDFATESVLSSAEKIIGDTLTLGINCLNTGKLHDAKSLFDAVLVVQSQNAAAQYYSGIVQIQLENFDAALTHLTIACDIESANGDIWIAVIDCLLGLQRHTEALDILEKTLAAGLNHPRAQPLRQAIFEALGENIAPPPSSLIDNEENLLTHLHTLAKRSLRRSALRRKSWSEASRHLADLLHATDWKGLADAGIKSLDRHPERGKDWDLLGIAFIQLGKTEAARITLLHASKMLPRDAEVWDHLGVAERLEFHLKAAEKCFLRSLAMNSNRPETWTNLGNLQHDQGALTAALNSFEHALKLQPDSFEAINNRGNVLRDMQRFEEAEESFRLLLQLRPDLPEAHANLGNVLKDRGQMEAAIACYQHALTIAPLAEAYGGLGRALIDQGRPSEALHCYERALEIQPGLLDVHSSLLKTMSDTCSHLPEQYIRTATRFGHQAALRVSQPFSHWTKANPDTPLHVGLISGDLGEHPVGYFLESMLSHIDAKKIILFAYPTREKNDALTDRLRTHVETWSSLVGMSDETAAQQIYADNIHILIDLSGHTAHQRLPLFSWRPAPVQVSWLGYYASTGMAQMDYFLADPYVAPEGEESHFIEKIWRLPETYLCFTPPNINLEVGPLPALKNGFVTFGCFNNLIKLNDEVIDVWSQLLHAVTGSKLYLKTSLLGNTNLGETTYQRFAQRGISPERLILEGASPRAELLACYNQVDIALDPFPYPGGTTSVEALWMGVPILTRQGDRFLSHVGESLAYNAGQAEWIAKNNDDYIAIALTHCQDLGTLSALRAQLRAQVLASPLFDGPRFARHWESALWAMWREKQEQGRIHKK